MKHHIEYEATDINIGNPDTNDDGDPLHQFLFGQLMVAALHGFKRDPDHPEDPLWVMKKQVALFLTGMDQQGWKLVPKEDVPAAFRDALK